MSPAMKEEIVDLTSILLKPSDAANTDNDETTAHLIVDAHCELGEGVLYDERSHTVLWTDILGKKFHELELLSTKEKGKFRTYDMPRMLCSFGMLESTTTTFSTAARPLLCAWEDGFQLYDVHQGKECSAYSEGEAVNPRGLPTRLNDGRTAPDNHYICGGYFGDLAKEQVTMKVFDVEQTLNNEGLPSLVHKPIVEAIEVTNSIAFAPDGKIMYLADSPTKCISSYQYQDGKISEKNTFHNKADTLEQGVPDGSCVDADGFLWNAVWRSGHGPGMVQRIDPASGKVVYTVHMPDDNTSQVTCCCFGGPDRNILFITSAAESRDPNVEPHAGGLYAAVVPFRGRCESRLNFSV